MGKEVAVKENKEVQQQLPQELMDWGDTGVNVGQDMLLPRLLVMQPTSDLVTDGQAVMGEFRNSVTGERLGSIIEPVEVICFHVVKSLDINRLDEGGQYLWDRNIPLVENIMSPDYNDNLPWEGKDEDGTPIKRIRRLDFFCLIRKDLASGAAMPYTLSFKSTSMKEGRKMLNQMYVRNKAAKVPPCMYSFILAGTKEKNDKGTFVKPNVSLGTLINVDELRTTKYWYDLVAKGQVKAELTGETIKDVDDTGLGEF